MGKIWFILINEREEGPFSPSELIIHPSFNPDTLVRKQGSTEWIPARFVFELREIFEDKEPAEAEDEPSSNFKVGDELVLDNREDPPQLYFWMLIAFILLVYTFIRFLET